jgi:hypothetical protein
MEAGSYALSVRFDAAVGASAQAATRDLVKPTDVVTPLAICAYCDHNQLMKLTLALIELDRRRTGI